MPAAEWGRERGQGYTLEFAKDDTPNSLLYEKGALFFEDAYAVECSPGEYASATGCEPCPVDENKDPVAFCAGGSNPPVALPGYMQLGNGSNTLTPGQVANAVFQFIKCTPASACQGGGKCAVGYETPANNCVGCVNGYYKLSGECKPCPDTAGLLLGIYCTVVLIFGVFGLLLVKKGPSVAVTGVGIDYFQVLSIFVGFGIKWPAPVKDVLNIVSVSNMNIELVSPQCTIKFEYHQKWLVIEFAPIALGLLALVGYGVVLLRKVVWHKAGFARNKRAHGNLHRHANAIIGAIILMFQFIYIYCTKTAFEIFACEEKENGKSYMYFEPEIECWTGIHNDLWPLALFFVGLYGVGLPILFTVIVIRNRKVIMQDQVLRVLGTGSSRTENPEHYEFRKRFYKLYYRFKPRYHYWGEVILFRKFIIVIVTVFLKKNPTLQATCAVMILFVSYSMHIRTMPYLRNDLLGCENIEGLDDGTGVGPRRLQSSEKQQRLNRAKEVALEMVNLDPKSISLQQSAADMAAKVKGTGSSLIAKSFRRPTLLSISKSPKSERKGSMKQPDSVGSKSPKYMAKRSSGSGGSAQDSVRVSIVEEKDDCGGGDGAATAAPAPCESSIRATMAKSQMSKEKRRRLYALIRMGEGQNIQGHAGNSDQLWERARSRSVSRDTASSEAGVGGIAGTNGFGAFMHGELIQEEEENKEEGENGDEEDEEGEDNTFNSKMKVSKSFLILQYDGDSK